MSEHSYILAHTLFRKKSAIVFLFFCSMYDVDGNGWIDLLEMTKMVRSIYQVRPPPSNSVNIHKKVKSVHSLEYVIVVN